MDFESIVGSGLFFLIVSSVFLAVEGSRASSVLEKWSKKRSLQITNLERRFARTGPYFMTHSTQNRIVYRLTVQYPSGRERSGYALVGGALLGVLSDNVEISWD